MKDEDYFYSLYEGLMVTAMKRSSVSGYTEKHHIVPKSWWKNNYTVVLTGEEHFMAHYWLHKAFPEDEAMSSALWIMCRTGSLKRGYTVAAEIYSESREAFSKSRSRKEQFNFIHREHGHRFCSAYELREEFKNLDRKSLNLVAWGLDGKMSLKGWQLGKPGDEFYKPRAGKNNPMYGTKGKTSGMGGKKHKLVNCEHCGNKVAVNSYGIYHKENKCKMWIAPTHG